MKVWFISTFSASVEVAVHGHVLRSTRMNECLPFTADPATHLQFLKDLLERVNTEKSPEAHVLLLATLAHAKLLYGDNEGTKNDIDAAWKVLDELSGVEPSVNAAYYGVAADYYKVRN